jgi:hypothetical protein
VETDVDRAIGCHGQSPAECSGAARRQGAEIQCSFDGALSPNEPTWKLRVAFERQDTPSPDRLWTVQNLAIPARGAEARLDQTAIRDGGTVRLLSLRLPPGGRWTRPPMLTLRAKVAPPSLARRVHLIRATNDRGHAVPLGSADAQEGRVMLKLKTLPEAKRINLTFAVRERCVVEFLAKPTQR